MLCSITHILRSITHNMLYNTCYVLQHVMLCYITHDKLCYITHDKLCYTTHDILRYDTCNAMLYNTYVIKHMISYVI